MKRYGAFPVAALLGVALGVAGCMTQSQMKTGSTALSDLDVQPGPAAGYETPGGLAVPVPAEPPLRAQPGAALASAMLIDLKVDPRLIVPADKAGPRIPVPEEPKR